MELTEIRKVRVYPFTMYDIMSDEAKLSRRMGKRDVIEAMGGTLITTGSIEIDEERLSKDYPGLTDIDFKP